MGVWSRTRDSYQLIGHYVPESVEVEVELEGSGRHDEKSKTAVTIKGLP